MRGLSGHVIIVTGASRGIGRAVARNLTEAGARIVCVATIWVREAFVTPLRVPTT